MYKDKLSRKIYTWYDKEKEDAPYKASFSSEPDIPPFIGYCGYGRTRERAMLNLIITIIVDSWDDDWWFIKQINELLDNLIEIVKERRNDV
jgi:hypothetical protein